METTDFIAYLIRFVMNVVVLAGIPLAAATLSGLLVSILQAVTQIQDQTLSQTVKITVIVAILLGFGGSLVLPLMHSTQQLFNEFGFLGF